jgi:peptidoglycan L-alanyl-D-glutamate endopeptidase CwlK
MRDKVSIARINTLHPLLRAEAQQLIEKAEAGLPLYLAIRVTQGYRTFAEQKALYDQGRRTPGNIVTNASPGSSYHNYGLALDFVILYDKDKNGTYDVMSWDTVKDEDKDGISDWFEIAKIFKAAGWTWGGDFKSIVDKPHVEKTFGKNWKILLDLKSKSKVDKDGYVILN